MSLIEVVSMPSLDTIAALACELGVDTAEADRLYRKADRIVAEWLPAGQLGELVELTPANVELARRFQAYINAKHPELGLTTFQVFDAVSIFNHDYLFWHPCPTDESFAEVAEECLTHAGLLDTPGDCPVCKGDGYMSARRHHVCTRVQLVKAKFLCGCGRPATDFRNWYPICDECYELKEHLDSLAD